MTLPIGLQRALRTSLNKGEHRTLLLRIHNIYITRRFPGEKLKDKKTRNKT